MRRKFGLSLAPLVLFAGSAIAEPSPEKQTVYHHAEKAWAVGTIRLEAKPLPFRDGKILVYPSQIVDLLWAPKQTKPRNLMLVHEVLSNEKDAPFFQQGEEFFAPIRLLPEHSYWKDNLPTTRRHAVAGGRRSVFRGDAAVEARRVLGTFLAAHDVNGQERWKAQLEAVAEGLVSSVPVLREDAVEYLAGYRMLARDLDDDAMADIRVYLSGAAPAEEKTRLVDALLAAKIPGIEPILVELSQREDATAAVALAGLERLGKGLSTDRLLGLSKSAVPELQDVAAEGLGARSAADAVARQRAGAILTSPDVRPAERLAVARGLARAGGNDVVELLAQAVEAGQAGSRPAAQSLATIGGPAAETALTKILEQKQGEAAIAAAYGLSQMTACERCGKTLHAQEEAHADPEVRSLISVLVGAPVEHKH